MTPEIGPQRVRNRYCEDCADDENAEYLTYTVNHVAGVECVECEEIIGFGGTAYYKLNHDREGMEL